MSEVLGLRRARVFEVARRSFTLPDLASLDPVASVTDPVESDTSATYFDTVDLRLTARQITVRRMASGDAAGWTLSMPDENGTATDVRASPGSPDDPAEAVPEELAELVRASVRDRDLGPVAAVRTMRIERRLLDVGGRELARVADDHVHGQRFNLGGVELSHWREIHIELTGGEAGLLDAVTESLDGAGLVPRGDSKLLRALGEPERPVIDLRGQDREGTAAEVVLEQLREEVTTLIDQDWAVRSGRPGAVHDMRSAARRLRCDLVTWRTLLDETRVEPLRRELRWLAALLGRLRDAEMLDARLVGMIRGLSADMVVGPVLPRVEREVQERQKVASERLAAALDGVRYFGLLDALETLVDDPPFTDRSMEPAEEALARRLAHALGRLDRALAEVDAPASPELRADLLHRVRKAAKRASYAAESIEPLFGRRARRIIERLVDLQDLLGEHHDSVVTRQALRDIGAAAHVAGESAFTYGILHGIEHDRGEEAEQGFEALRRAMDPPRAHRWVNA